MPKQTEPFLLASGSYSAALCYWQWDHHASYPMLFEPAQDFNLRKLRNCKCRPIFGALTSIKGVSLLLLVEVFASSVLLGSVL